MLLARLRPRGGGKLGLPTAKDLSLPKWCDAEDGLTQGMTHSSCVLCTIFSYHRVFSVAVKIGLLLALSLVSDYTENGSSGGLHMPSKCCTTELRLKPLTILFLDCLVVDVVTL